MVEVEVVDNDNGREFDCCSGRICGNNSGGCGGSSRDIVDSGCPAGDGSVGGYDFLVLCSYGGGMMIGKPMYKSGLMTKTIATTTTAGTATAAVLEEGRQQR